jgi:hypothetical protein
VKRRKREKDKKQFVLFAGRSRRQSFHFSRSVRHPKDERDETITGVTVELIRRQIELKTYVLIADYRSRNEPTANDNERKEDYDEENERRVKREKESEVR